MSQIKHAAPRATMVRSANIIVRLLFWWFFSKVSFGQRLVGVIREAASRGPVVYVLQTRSVIDQLYFNYAFSKFGLPLAQWSNGSGTILFRRFFSMVKHSLRRRNPRDEVEQLLYGVDRGKASLVFLERALYSEVENRAFSQQYLEGLVAWQGTHEAPVQVVPLGVIWERRSEEFHPGLLDDLFGSRQAPGFFRKIFYVIKNLGQAFLLMGSPLATVGEPVDLRDHCRGQGGAAPAQADALRARLVALLEQERAVVVGPRFKKGAVIRRELLADPKFRDEVEAIASQLGVPPEQALRAARQNLSKIGADFSMLGIKFLATLLTPIWHIIYDGLDVDEEGLDRVRAAARDARIVLIPSHKSHIDYLIISHLFYLYGLIPPHIAAGDNLSFPPMGTIFRRAGAFFIRRHFKDDPLYGLCVQRYIGKILSEGHPIEFFIEGGRSRTGKLLAPRFGMLRMMVDSFLTEDFEKLRFVPCAVTYERIVEGSSYGRELVGGEKKQENIGALLRSTKVLTSRYGRLYVSFGEPVELGEYLRRYEVDAESASDEVQRLTERLGYRLIYGINHAGTVSPSALTSLALMSNTRRGMSQGRLTRVVGFVLDLLIRKDVRLSPSLRTALASKRASIKQMAATDTESPAKLAFLTDPLSEADEDRPGYYLTYGKAVEALVDEAIKLFSDSKLVDLTRVHAGQATDRFFYSVPEKARGELSYYKNMILHALVPEALLSTALLEPGSAVMDLEPLMERTLFLSKLFKHEFFYEERVEFSNVFWRTFEQFAARGWVRSVKGREGPVVLQALPLAPLEFFRTLITTFLEAYTLVAIEFEYLRGRWVSEKDFLDHLLVSCRLHYHEGAVRFLETLAKPTFANAVKRFVEWGYLETSMVEKRRRMVRMVRLAEGEGIDHAAMVARLRLLLRGRTGGAAASSEVA